VVIVVERLDGPRRLRNSDDDDDECKYKCKNASLSESSKITLQFVFLSFLSYALVTADKWK